MKTYKVHMMAFGKPGEIREVDLPEPVPTDIEELAEEIFRLGQNDFQPKCHCSVSMGDVMEIDGKLYGVAAFGIKEITQQQFEEYKNIPQRDRIFKW